MQNPHTKTSKQTPASLWAKGIIVVLCVALLASMVYFVIDVRSLYTKGVIAPAVSRVSGKHHGVPINSPTEIQGWMTFHYIEKVFQLPPNYLEASLGLETTNANSTVDQYASEHHMNSVDFLQSVRSAVASYSNKA